MERSMILEGGDANSNSSNNSSSGENFQGVGGTYQTMAIPSSASLVVRQPQPQKNFLVHPNPISSNNNEEEDERAKNRAIAENVSESRLRQEQHLQQHQNLDQESQLNEGPPLPPLPSHPPSQQRHHAAGSIIFKDESAADETGSITRLPIDFAVLDGGGGKQTTHQSSNSSPSLLGRNNNNNSYYQHSVTTNATTNKSVSNYSKSCPNHLRNGDDDDMASSGSTIDGDDNTTFGHDSSKTTNLFIGGGGASCSSGFMVGFATMKRVDLYDYDSVVEKGTIFGRSESQFHHHHQNKQGEEINSGGGGFKSPDLSSLGSCSYDDDHQGKRHHNNNFLTATPPLVARLPLLPHQQQHFDDNTHQPQTKNNVIHGSGGGDGDVDINDDDDEHLTYLAGVSRTNSASLTMFGLGGASIDAARQRKAALRPTISLLPPSGNVSTTTAPAAAVALHQ